MRGRPPSSSKTQNQQTLTAMDIEFLNRQLEEIMDNKRPREDEYTEDDDHISKRVCVVELGKGDTLLDLAWNSYLHIHSTETMQADSSYDNDEDNDYENNDFSCDEIDDVNREMLQCNSGYDYDPNRMTTGRNGGCHHHNPAHFGTTGEYGDDIYHLLTPCDGTDQVLDEQMQLLTPTILAIHPYQEEDLEQTAMTTTTTVTPTSPHQHQQQQLQMSNTVDIVDMNLRVRTDLGVETITVPRFLLQKEIIVPLLKQFILKRPRVFTENKYNTMVATNSLNTRLAFDGW